LTKIILFHRLLKKRIVKSVERKSIFSFAVREVLPRLKAEPSGVGKEVHSGAGPVSMIANLLAGHGHSRYLF